jgi:hypothetical protein
MRFWWVLFAAFAGLATRPVLAQSWSGFLVNFDCYESLERNVDPWDTSSYVDRDRDWEIRYCSPNTKTKSFVLVDHDGVSYKLDSSGNAKAAEIVRQTGKKEFLEVAVTGGKSKDQIRVDSISRAR